MRKPWGLEWGGDVSHRLRFGPIGPATAIARTAAALAFLCSVGAGDVLGGVIRVPDDHPTIQEAVDAASPGDVIQVRAGVYPERVTIRQSSIRLQSHPEHAAILDGSGTTDARPALSILGTASLRVARVSVVGFSIQNYPGNGISLMFADDCKVLRNRVHNVGGQGIAVARSTSNRIARNTLQNGAIGVSVSTQSSDNTVQENTIAGFSLHGIRVSMTNNTPLRNKVVENVICVQGGLSGIDIASFAAANIVKENRIAGEGAVGILLEASTSGNIVKENVLNGVSIDVQDLSLGANIVGENEHDPTLGCP